MRAQTTWGSGLIDRLLDDPSTIRVDASDMELDGFVDDIFTEYRRRSVVRIGSRASLTYEAPACGLRYLGFVIYDSLFTETVEVRIDGVVRAVVAIDGNCQRERLLTLAEPVDFRGGEQVRLVGLPREPADPDDDRGPVRAMSPYSAQWDEGGESHRIEGIAFFAELPPENDLPCDFAHVHADAGSTAAGRGASANPVGYAYLTWVTTWDSRCTVEYWAEGGQAETVEETRAWTNHRVKLDGLMPDATYRWRLSAAGRHGRPVASGAHSFTTSPAPAPVGSAAYERLDLSVRGAEGRRLTAPVTSGVPFPEGVLASSENLRMRDRESGVVPLQARTLGRWPDGTVKWALLDFQAAPASGSVCILEYGSDVARDDRRSSLMVDDGAAAVTIDTGRLTITVDKLRSVPFARILRDGRPYVGRAAAALRANGVEYLGSNAAPDVVDIEEAGPLRCVVRVEGDHVSERGEALFRSVFRLHAYAGLPFVRLDHTFVNSNTDRQFTDIDSMFVRFDLPHGDRRATELTQTHDNRAVVDGEIRETRLDGTVRAGDVEVAVVDFWQQYPKSLSVDEQSVTVGICPPIGTDDYPKVGEEAYKLYFYLRDGAYRLREGHSKTHTMYIGEEIPPLPMPTAQAPPRWSCETGAFGEVLPVAEGAFPDYERRMAEQFDAYLGNHDSVREYGMLNFGDCYAGHREPEEVIPGEVMWMNTEYDTGFVSFLQWARSGDPRFYEEGRRAAMHHRDVDTCHHSAQTTRVGGVYAHSNGHVGEYYPYKPKSPLAASPEEFRASLRKGGVPWGTFTVSHTWVDGFLLHHFLTGDRRSLETARLVAERYDGQYTRNFDFVNCRNNGWHLVLSMAMYAATGDRFHLNAAHIVVERTLERQTEDGGWRRMLVPGHCHCEPPRHVGNAGFMVGVLLNGLKLYHEATGDPRVAESIVAGARFLVDTLWIGEQGFRYTSCPHSQAVVADLGQMLAGIAYAWRLSNDERFEPVLRVGTRLAIRLLDPSGRILSANMRVLPNILYDLRNLPEPAPVEPA